MLIHMIIYVLCFNSRLDFLPALRITKLNWIFWKILWIKRHIQYKISWNKCKRHAIKCYDNVVLRAKIWIAQTFSNQLLANMGSVVYSIKIIHKRKFHYTLYPFQALLFWISSQFMGGKCNKTVIICWLKWCLLRKFWL